MLLTLNIIIIIIFKITFYSQIYYFEHVTLSRVQESSQEFTVQHSSCVHFTLGDEPRRLCCSNIRSTLLDRLVCDRKFTKILTNHLRLHERERERERERRMLVLSQYGFGDLS